MHIDITSLWSGNLDKIEIDESYSFSKEELKNSGILELNDVRVTGYINRNGLDDDTINIIVKGTMILPCALTLKEVPYDFEIKIDENLSEIQEEIGKNLKNGQKTLDILPIIWENILMEIPMRVVSDDVSDALTKGDGWELVTDEK